MDSFNTSRHGEHILVYLISYKTILNTLQNQAIGGLLVNPPQTLGDGDSGTVLSIGPDVKNFSVGDQVFGFTWRSAQEKAHQERIVAREFLWAKIPDGFEAKEVVAVPNNFVTAFSSLMRDLRQELPWPKPEGYESKDAGKVFLIWGGSSSVGQYTIQILKYYGYEKIIATGSTKHHELLESLGATALVDYKNADVVEQIWKTANGTVDFVVDCIGSLEGSVRPISKLAKEGAIVAIMLPVILKDATATEKPEYEMDVVQLVPWKTGVEAKGVRTHFYLDVSMQCDKSINISGLTADRTCSLQSTYKPTSCRQCSRAGPSNPIRS